MADSRRLRLVASPDASAGLLPAALAELDDAPPTCELTVVQRPDQEALAAVRRCEADLALICRAETGPAPDSGLRERVLSCDRLMLAVPAGHPVGRGRRAELADLARERWVLPSPGHLNHVLTLAACRKSGFAPVGAYQTDDPGFALELVGAGLGVALLPPLALAQASDAVRPLAVRDAPVRLLVAAWSGQNGTGAVEMMLDCLAAQAIGAEP